MNNIASDIAISPDAIFEYRPRLYLFVLSQVRDPEVAEDVTQESLLKAVRALEAGQQPWALASWLCRIATNLIIDRTRRRNRVRFDSIEPQDEGEEPREFADARAERPGLALERRELQAHVREAVAALSDNHRDVVMLRYVGQLEVNEIARRLDICEGTVKSRLSRARGSLERRLSRYVEAN